MSQQNRSTNLVTTATTVVALLALASMVRVAPAMEVGCVETRMTVRESAVLRAVVVAVAAARDLFGTDQTVTAVNVVSNHNNDVPIRCAAHLYGCDHRNIRNHNPLDERLLDLPPPLA